MSGFGIGRNKKFNESPSSLQRTSKQEEQKANEPKPEVKRERPSDMFTQPVATRQQGGVLEIKNLPEPSQTHRPKNVDERAKRAADADARIQSQIHQIVAAQAGGDAFENHFTHPQLVQVEMASLMRDFGQLKGTQITTGVKCFAELKALLNTFDGKIKAKTDAIAAAPKPGKGQKILKRVSERARQQSTAYENLKTEHANLVAARSAVEQTRDTILEVLGSIVQSSDPKCMQQVAELYETHLRSDEYLAALDHPSTGDGFQTLSRLLDQPGYQPAPIVFKAEERGYDMANIGERALFPEECVRTAASGFKVGTEGERKSIGAASIERAIDLKARKKPDRRTEDRCIVLEIPLIVNKERVDTTLAVSIDGNMGCVAADFFVQNIQPFFTQELQERVLSSGELNESAIKAAFEQADRRLGEEKASAYPDDRSEAKVAFALVYPNEGGARAFVYTRGDEKACKLNVHTGALQGLSPEDELVPMEIRGNAGYGYSSQLEDGDIIFLSSDGLWHQASIQDVSNVFHTSMNQVSERPFDERVAHTLERLMAYSAATGQADDRHFVALWQENAQ